jgi:hypothetical protein
MTIVLFLTAWLAVGAASVAGPQSVSADAQTEQELKTRRDAFFEALRRGDRPLLEPFLATGFAFTHATGRLEERDEFIARVIADVKRGPAPAIEFLEDHIRIYDGRTAVWTTRSLRRGGPTGDIEFRSTDVLVKTDGQWKWAAVHSTRLSRYTAVRLLPWHFAYRIAVWP